ncbi:amino acid adenylation domain-containing protein [Streptomyces sp. NPDC003996]
MNPQVPSDEAALLVQLVAGQADLTPHTVAVTDGACSLGYAELDARANRLAHLLLEAGVAPDTVVGVCLPRSVELVVALLGVWRAGGGYLPLTPDLPAARLARLIGDSGVDLVITDVGSAQAVRDAGADPIVLDELAERLDALPATAPQVRPAAEHVAYVIYTSGSTGEPKGVAVTHGGIANRVRWVVRECGLTEQDTVLQKTAVTFDAHCWEVFAPLISGGTVALAPVGVEADPAAMLRAVADRRATVLQVVPSVLRLLLEEDGWERCDALRLLFSAGEPLTGELVSAVRSKAEVQVWNTYGPTECSIDVTAHRVDPEALTGPVPIGRPITGMRVLVVDAAGRPLGPGRAGELLAGGIGLARGYLGRPALTADSFVPDPFAGDGSRLYRTGDRVRWRRDGVLEYLGRIDDQLKINGVRVEPAEIEAALLAHPSVLMTAVVGYQTSNGDKRLAAHYVLRPEAPRAGSAELRGFLAEVLAPAMVPGTFVEHASLPLGSTGKIDRKALVAPAAGSGGRRRPPVTEAQQLVAGAWRTVLGVAEVGLDDDFFALGGTSLQLTRLVTRLRELSGSTVALRGLFGATTVAAQAELLGAAAEPGPKPVDRGRPLPLSPGQRRIWFSERLRSGVGEWVSGLVLPVPADAGVPAIQRALDLLVERHEALRSRFPEIDGVPVQVVDPPAPVGLRVVRGGAAAVPGVLRTEQQEGFDLATGPLLRAVLAEDGTDRTLCLLIHHIASDGWSTGILEREFTELLGALAAGRTPELPALPIQYGDYAVWQQEAAEDPRTERELEYWVNELDGLTALRLPTDRPRPAVRDGRGSIVPLEIDAERSEALDRLARKAGTTRFTVLLTAFATLLGRHGGSWDLPIGTPVAGREFPQTEGVVGFFLNSLVLRARLEPELSFTEAVHRLGRTVKTALAHQSLPFDRLVERIAPERDLSRTPVFQAAFDFHDAGFNALIGEDTRVESLAEMWHATHTDLTLILRPRSDGSLVGGLEYATALFDQATVRRMTEHLLRILETAATTPRLALAELPLLSEAEVRTVDAWGTGEPADETAPASVPALVARRAAENPDAVALAGEDGVWTYARLDDYAGRLASRLRAAGVGAEDVVVVAMDRGPRLVAALLAVWKATGAYLPVDPGFPADRVARMAEAAGARVLLADGPNTERFAAAADSWTVLDVAREQAAIEACEPLPPAADDLDRLAYLIFTSGSTGRPKGVAVTHRGLANHVRWAARTLVEAAPGGGALFSSIAFDLVVPNVWAPLTTGERVWLQAQDGDLYELDDHLAKAGPFGFLKLTPSHLQVLTDRLGPERCVELVGEQGLIVAAGERLPATLARPWAAALGDGRLINEYGPTETSVGTCVFPVDNPVLGDEVPIGRPLPGMVMRVLDEGMRPVPVGVIGELHVGGTGVARGYHGRPGLTGERFLPDPLGAPGARLYRTGDLVRWTVHGQVEFVGRIDEQVKIRGFRVEPGEVRSVLLEHPAVRDTAVVPVPRPSGELQLAAYYVLADPAQPVSGDAELAAHCARALPEYMIPASFTVLDRIPLNANGKLDRSALPGPEAGTAVSAPTGPRDLGERLIFDIWQDLLGGPVGVEENFFQAGGSSILAIQLVARLREAFHLQIGVRHVFEAPTIAEMARLIEDMIRQDDAARGAAPDSPKGHNA